MTDLPVMETGGAKEGPIKPAIPDPVLPGEVPLKLDETLTDWLFRAGALHGYRSPDIIAGLVAGVFPDVALDPRYETKLATLLSADVAEVRKRAVRPTPGLLDSTREKVERVSFFGHTLLTQQVRSHGQWVCPKCLSEDAYLRSTWTLAECGVCHRHRCQLVNECPACENPLQYNRRNIELCRCGYDLRWIRPSEASPEAARMWQYVDGLVNSRLDGHDGTYAEDIRKLNLESFLKLLPILGAIKSNADRAPSLTMLLSQASQFSPSELRIWNEAAADLLIDWPLRLEEHILRGLEVLPRGAAVWRNATGAITALSGWKLPGELKFLDQIVEKCVSVRWNRFLQQKRINHHASGHGGSTSESSSIATSQATRGQCGGDDAMPVHDAATMLGMNTGDVMKIFDSWHLAPARTLQGRPASPRVVSRAAIYAWRDDLASCHTPWVDSPLDQYQRLHEAKNVCRDLGIKTSSLFRAIQNGSVRVCIPPGLRFNFGQAYLNESDLVNWWQDTAAKTGLTKLRVDVARRMMNLDSSTFECLIAAGALPFEPKPSGRDDRMTTAQSVFDGMRALRVLRRIEEFCGVRASHLDRWLAEAGVVPLTGRDVPISHPRPTRMVRTSELQVPGILAFLHQSARTRWTARSDA